MSDFLLAELAKELRSTDDAKTTQLRQATITSVQTTTVTITLGGSALQIPGVKYLSSYVPQVNDIVWVSFVGTSMFILGKLSGPTTVGEQGMDRIASTVLGASTGSVTFSSITTAYTHLKIIAYCRVDAVGTVFTLYLRFNGDTTGAYDWQLLSGNNTTVTAERGVGQTHIRCGVVTGSTMAAGAFAVSEILIPNYKDGANSTMVLATTLSSDVTAGNGFARVTGGKWANAGDVTSITLLGSSGNFIAGSRFDLYGIR